MSNYLQALASYLPKLIVERANDVNNRGQNTVFTAIPFTDHLTAPAWSAAPIHRESPACQAPIQSAVETVCFRVRSCRWLPS